MHFCIQVELSGRKVRKKEPFPSSVFGSCRFHKATVERKGSMPKFFSHTDIFSLGMSLLRTRVASLLCALGLAVLGRHWERIKPASLSLSGDEELGVPPTPCQSGGKSFCCLQSAEFMSPERAGKTVFPQVNPEALYRDPKWDKNRHGDMDVPLFLRYNVRGGKSGLCCNGKEETKALSFLLSSCA